MVAYARRHADVFEHMVKNYRAASARAKSSFDLLSAAVLSSRSGTSTGFQHSPNSPQNRELEWRLCASLLFAEPGTWLHYPLPQVEGAGTPMGLYQGLHWLARYQANEPDRRASPQLTGFLRAMRARDMVLTPSTLSRFLSATEGSNPNFSKGAPFVPVGAATARAVLECFPLRDALSEDYGGADSADLALPITQWPADNPDRLVVMEMLLEQGLVVDGKMKGYGNYAAMGRSDEQLQDTCLIQAAGRGDADMVALLLRHGAGRDVQGAYGHTAAQRARVKGHIEVAEYLEIR
jgi:hypothetical protein